MEPSRDRRELLFQPRGIPPLGTATSLALQHLVAMIVGCVTPPIIIAGAIGLSQEEQVLLIQASLVMSAVSTFLQLFPVGGRFGSGLPVILGVSFAYVPSMQAIAASGGGVAAIAGAMIVGVPGGLLMANCVVEYTGDAMYRLFSQVERLRGHFANVYVIDASDDEFGGADNYLLIATDGSYPFTGVIPYGD